MARRLILLRHGDAVWQSPSGTDDQRPLSATGTLQAETVARLLREHGWIPESIVHSPAVRARDTARAVANALGLPLSSLPALYDGGVREIQESVVRETNDAISTLLLVGHNPSFSTLASVLTGLRVSLAPGNAALLATHATGWGEAALSDGKWKLERHLVPG